MTTLKTSLIITKLGSIVAVSSDDTLYLLEFTEKHGLEAEIERLKKRLKVSIVEGSADPIALIKEELADYFNGRLKKFTTPISLTGTPFQKAAWKELMRVPYGQTRTYAEQASAITKPTAYRAVANANASNKFVIIVPCHRIVNTNGNLGGYAAGIGRKQWLLEHEKSFTN